MNRKTKAGMRTIIPVIPAPEITGEPARKGRPAIFSRISASLAVIVIVASVLALISSYGANTNAEPDTTPPNITNITIAEIKAVSASITFITDEPADTKVIYGITEEGLSE